MALISTNNTTIENWAVFTLNVACNESLSHKVWHETLAVACVINNCHQKRTQLWMSTTYSFKSASLGAAVINSSPHFNQDGMLEWQASMLSLAAAAKEEGLKQAAWLMKLTYQASVSVRRITACLGDPAPRLGVRNIPACWCQSREWRQCRCKQPGSCARSQQAGIRQEADYKRNTHKRCTCHSDKLFLAQGWSVPLFLF